MRKNIIKSVLAIGAVIGTLLASGCSSGEPIQGVYGPPPSEDMSQSE